MYNILYSFNLNNASINTFNYNPNSFAQNNQTAESIPTTRLLVVGSVVEWLTHRTDDQHGLGSKPTCAILLCSWEKHFTALSPAWWS